MTISDIPDITLIDTGSNGRLDCYALIINKMDTVQLDALPYADSGYDDPAVRSAVNDK